jgi:hypothetical protein
MVTSYTGVDLELRVRGVVTGAAWTSGAAST